MATENNIELLATHQPALSAGTYRVRTISQLTAPGVGLSPINKTQLFHVAGDRYSLNPTDVFSVFPQEGSFADYSESFPQIIFNRSTLPWERSASASTQQLPWLGLLLFEATEAFEVKSVFWKQGMKYLTDGTANESVFVPYQFTDEPSDLANSGESTDVKVEVIDVDFTLLNSLMPKISDLPWLAHVRRADGVERAVVMGNRLPKSGGTYVVHLVSFENLYPNLFEQKQSNINKIRLLSLKKWGFSCENANETFPKIISNLVPSSLGVDTETSSQIKFRKQRGRTMLLHQMRQGYKNVSWYSGPFKNILVNDDRPLQIPTSTTTGANSADSRLSIDKLNNIFDVTYSAAWQLGRQLALAHPTIIRELYKLRRIHAQQIKKLQQNGQLNISTTNLSISAEVINWYRDVLLLKGIPFNYLLPDAKLLPEKTFWFFNIDNFWIQSFREGIESVSKNEMSLPSFESDLRQVFINELGINLYDGKNLSGVLIRSSKLARWKDLNALREGYVLRRLDWISDDILLCLFEGVLTNNTSNVELSLKPKILHQGFDLVVPPDNTDDVTTLRKTLRGLTTTVKVAPALRVGTQSGLRVIGINELANTIKSQLGNPEIFTSAQFAYQMMSPLDKLMLEYNPTITVMP